MPQSIIGIGETVLDIVFKENQPQAAVPGGSTFNAMISLGRTAGRQNKDLTLLMITQIGDDAVADIVTDFAARNGLAPEGIRRVPGQSNVSLALLDERNNAHYEFFRNPTPQPFQVPQVAVNPGDVVLFGSFFAINPETAPQTKAFVKAAREQGAIVYYDINYRKGHAMSPEALRASIEENMGLSDIVRGSDEDIEALYGSADAAKVVTTIGAGDNFNAGTVYALVGNGFDKERVRHLDAPSWPQLVPVALKFSAEVCASLFNYVGEDFLETI
jgi:fructokinase